MHHPPRMVIVDVWPCCIALGAGGRAWIYAHNTTLALEHFPETRHSLRTSCGLLGMQAFVDFVIVLLMGSRDGRL